MIDYVIILFAVVCFAGQFAFTKLYEGEVGQTATGSLCMLMGSSLVGVLLFLCLSGFRVTLTPISLLYAALLALVMIPYYMIGIRVLSLGSLAIYSMFMMLGGMLVPFFYGILFLDEGVSIGKLLGTVLLCVFIVLQAIWQKPEDARQVNGKAGKYLFFLLCLLIFFINGLTGVIAKAHSISDGAVDEMSFTVLSCALTALFGLLMLLFPLFKNKAETLCAMRIAFRGKPLIITVLLGAAAYGGSFLQLLAAGNVPASVQFPLVSGGVIVLSALVSAFCLCEKLSKKEWISTLGAFAATFLFAF